MAIGPKPGAEVAITASIVRALLQEQQPDLADLALIEVGEGWDNVLFRLGDELAVRVPRRAVSASLIQQEQRWLPVLSPRLPVPIPVALRVGRPGCGFPWAWSVVPWLPGHSALLAPPRDPTTTVVTLGRFLRALHQPAPDDAPRNPWRGIPLAARAATLQAHLERLDGHVDRGAVLRLWSRAVSTPPWPGPPLWIHGDLHPGNLLVSGDRLSGIIDFGDLTAGDPATDLSVIWMLPRPAGPAVLAAALGECYSLDTDTLMRARGWALALGLAYLVDSRDDERMAALGLGAINSALNDDPRDSARSS